MFPSPLPPLASPSLVQSVVRQMAVASVPAHHSLPSSVGNTGPDGSFLQGFARAMTPPTWDQWKAMRSDRVHAALLTTAWRPWGSTNAGHAPELLPGAVAATPIQRSLAGLSGVYGRDPASAGQEALERIRATRKLWQAADRLNCAVAQQQTLHRMVELPPPPDAVLASMDYARSRLPAPRVIHAQLKRQIPYPTPDLPFPQLRYPCRAQKREFHPNGLFLQLMRHHEGISATRAGRGPGRG